MKSFYKTNRFGKMLKPLATLFLFVAFFMNLNATPVGITRYVNPDGVCGSNTPCYTTIQAAVSAASDGDVIQIANGTYYLTTTLYKK